MKVFSFCLYGTEPNYYNGLLENIECIRQWFPTFSIVVYKGVCDPSWEIPHATVIETGREGAINMLYRYFPLKTAEVGFVRDADSRITERDRWCINDFLNSKFSYHMIRDHIWHRSRIMGGIFGWKRPLDIDFDVSANANYGYDEYYLSTHLYPHISKDMLIHTNTFAFYGETTRRIEIPMKDPTDFVGNVIWNGQPRFVDMSNPLTLIQEARGQDQFHLMKYLSEQVDPLSIPYDQRRDFFDAAYIANYYLRDVATAQLWMSRFEFAEIIPHIYENGNFLLPMMGKIVACFDPEREPKEGEVVIYYGAYPDWHLALPCSNKIYRHVSRFFDVKHDVVLYHPAWEAVGTIYILNLEERVDRYYDTLLALAAVHAPLHRVHHYKAKKGDLPPYIGATKNHVDVIQHFCEGDKETCLILEDDFVFIDNRSLVWSSLSKLWSQAFTICFLSLSKFGERVPVSDLLCKSRQACTTSSGYILRRDTARQVLDTVAEGLQKMQETGDQHTYCIDRYWSRLPDLVCPRPKLGFQRPSYSNLIQRVSAHLD